MPETTTTNPQPAETVQGTNAAGTGDQALGTSIAAAVAAGVETAVQQLTGVWNDRLSTLENALKRSTVDDDVHNELVETGAGDPMDRAERMRNARDRTDFYRDELQAQTVQFGALMNHLTARFLGSFGAREADRYSAGSPVPPGAKSV